MSPAMVTRREQWFVVPVALIAALAVCRPACAQSDASVELIVESGRPLRVALTDSSTVSRVGQAVTATALESPPRASRRRSMLSGDFSPHRVIQLQFDSVVRNGTAVPMHTIAMNGT